MMMVYSDHHPHLHGTTINFMIYFGRYEFHFMNGESLFTECLMLIEYGIKWPNIVRLFFLAKHFGEIKKPKRNVCDVSFGRLYLWPESARLSNNGFQWSNAMN